MPYNSRVFVSLFIISIIILPAIYILGIFLPMVIDQFITLYLGDFSDLITVLGVFLLIMSIIPPWDKKKLEVLIRNCKNFFKSRKTEEIAFKDEVIHFANSNNDSEEMERLIQYIDDNLLLDETESWNNSKLSLKLKNSNRCNKGMKFSFWINNKKRSYYVSTIWDILKKQIKWVITTFFGRILVFKNLICKRGDIRL